MFKGLDATFKYLERRLNKNVDKNFWIWVQKYHFVCFYEKTVTCKRDPEARDRDETETETLGKCVSRPSRDRDIETETTSLIIV